MVRIHHEFEWDDDKAASNLQKQGVSFDEAVEVLADEQGDSRHFDVTDPEHADGEDRVLTYAPSPSYPGEIFIISWTDRSTDDEKITRIISARKANKKERRTYVEGLGL